MKQYKLLDVASFVASLMIIALHYHPLTIGSIADHWITYLCRIAVPIFFMRSGYFFRIEKFGIWLKRITIMMIFWSIVYLPLCVLAGRCNSIIDFVTIMLTKGTYYHLWYFPSLLISVCLIYLSVKLHINRYLLMIIAYMPFMIAISYGIYPDAIISMPGVGGCMEWMMNYYDTPYYCPIFNGFIFVVAGYSIKSFETEHNTIAMRELWILFVASLLLYFIEEIVTQNYFPHEQTEISLGILVLSICIFWGLIKSKDKFIISEAWAKRLRVMSTIIFVIHCWIGFAILHIFHCSPIVNYLLTVFTSLSIAYILTKFSTKSSYFKYLF